MKCPVCRRVVQTDDPHDCKPDPAPGTRSPSAESVRRHRERTGNAYGKAYAKARASAVQLLIAQHPDEFATLLEKARIEAGLGPTRA